MRELLTQGAADLFYPVDPKHQASCDFRTNPKVMLDLGRFNGVLGEGFFSAPGPAELSTRGVIEKHSAYPGQAGGGGSTPDRDPVRGPGERQAGLRAGEGRGVAVAVVFERLAGRR